MNTFNSHHKYNNNNDNNDDDDDDDGGERTKERKANVFENVLLKHSY